MAHLYYMSLPNVGHWDRALTDSGAHLKPFRAYLRTACDAAISRPPILGWELATEAQAQRFDARLRRRFEDAQRRAAAGERRRDRHGPAGLAKGKWIRLVPPPWNPEEPDSTFDAFLDRKAEIHQRPPGSRDRGARVLEFDREGCAILLAETPLPIERAAQGGEEESEGPGYFGRLIFLKPNTYMRMSTPDPIKTPAPRAAESHGFA